MNLLETPVCTRPAPLAVGIAVALALLAGSRTRPVAAQAPLVVRMATFVPDGSSWYQILKETAEKWKTASGGRVRVRLFPGGVAGDDRDVVAKMRLGTLDAAVLTAVGVGEIDRSVNALGLPLLYDSYEEADYVLEKMRPRLEAGLEAKGFVVLNWADGGFVRFFAQKPVAAPDDLRAMKLFSGAGDVPSAELWRAAGFDPVALAPTELSAALESGRVTALGAPPQLAVLTQYFLHAKHMTSLRWQLVVSAALVTRTTWDKVPSDVRPSLLEAARADGQRLQQEIRRSEDKDIAEMQKRGLNLVAVDAKARALWQKTAEGLYPKMRGTLVPAEAQDEVLRFRDEYRKRPKAD
jgi:TRAP-type C4-dicarboxylate transport system substrate-binding protein